MQTIQSKGVRTAGPIRVRHWLGGRGREAADFEAVALARPLARPLARLLAGVLVGALLTAAVAPPAHATPEEADLLRERMEQLEASGGLVVAGVEITATDLLLDFYARRGFEPAWHDAERLEELRELADLAVEEGLSARDYPLAELTALVDKIVAGATLADRLDADILATETLIRIGYQLRFGKVNPAQLDADWNYDRRLQHSVDPVETVEYILEAPNIRARVEEMLGRDWFFAATIAALARYRAIEQAGGWPEVAAGPTLRAGDSGSRVAALRARLVVEGDLASDSGSPEFDETLEAAVERFQARHNLEADGIVGKATLAELNVPVAVRIDQLRATLERSRWVNQEVEESGDFVIVNIADFRLALVRGGQIDWRTRVVVGKPYHRTPVFKGTMRYLVLNPTWTVPYSISTKELLPKIQRDPGYLASRNFDVLTRDGRKIDPSKVDWKSLSRRSFPYTLRQGPGPGNALGRVKFMFPNEHAVYLHDTPARALFDKAERSFSHGCVRVNDPLELARRVLDDPERWSRAQIDAQIESGELLNVTLAEPLPVFILYWTAHADPDGTVRFARDIYERDGKLLEALDGPVRIDLPDA